MIKRIFDVLFSLTFLFLSLPLLVIVGILVKLSSRGPILYWSVRIGRNGILFYMPKFRTMKVGTPVVATNLLHEPFGYLTPVGSFLRKSSLDELPQLWSILRGDMSFVGPRPALFNQYDLISLRIQCGVYALVPGLTGWAQVNGRDELTLAEKIRFDYDYLIKKNFFFDMKILLLTIFKITLRSGVMH